MFMKHIIKQVKTLNQIFFKKIDQEKLDKSIGKVIIYNPDKWMYVTFDLYDQKFDDLISDHIYKVLHVSS